MPDTPPSFVDPEKDEQVPRVQKMYRAAIAALAAIFTGVSARSINRGQAQRQAVLIAAELERATRTWISEAVVEWYKEGLYVSIATIVNSGAKMKYLGFSPTDRIMLQNLADSIWLDFGRGISGVRSSALSALTDAERVALQQQLARGIGTGQTLRELRAALEETFRQRGFTALIDRGGRRWSLDVYSDMLARTKRTQVANTAVQTRMAENNEDLTVVSSHNSKHELCRTWEGRVLAISGKTKGIPSVSFATASGLFHPNCQHRLYPYVEGVSGRPTYQFTEQAQASQYFKQGVRLKGSVEDWARGGVYDQAHRRAITAKDTTSAEIIRQLAPKYQQERLINREQKATG